VTVVAKEAPNLEEDEPKEEMAPREFIRKRTKTRSKQKNKRRDNRPIEVKRAKLAERGIII
jgi:hypothetical protein